MNVLYIIEIGTDVSVWHDNPSLTCELPLSCDQCKRMKKEMDQSSQWWALS